MNINPEITSGDIDITSEILARALRSILVKPDVSQYKKLYIPRNIINIDIDKIFLSIKPNKNKNLLQINLIYFKFFIKIYLDTIYS